MKKKCVPRAHLFLMRKRSAQRRAQNFITATIPLLRPYAQQLLCSIFSEMNQRFRNPGRTSLVDDETNEISFALVLTVSAKSSVYDEYKGFR